MISRSVARTRATARARSALAALLLTACGGAEGPRPVTFAELPGPPRAGLAPRGTQSGPVRAATPDAPFRAQAPAPLPTPAFVAPRIEDFRLANGVRVLLVERHELPVVVARYVTRRGGDDTPVTKAGLPSLVGSLLEQGTTSRDAIALSDAFAALGADHGTAMGWDGGGAYVKVLAPHFAAALELLADVVQHPAFAPAELERVRARRLASLRQERDAPGIIAGNVTARAVYGDTHPYGRSVAGNETAVRGITRDDVVRFYRSHFVPADGALVIVGDVTRAAVAPLLDRSFARWRASAPAARPLAAPPAPRPTPRVYLVDRPGAPQSQVTLAHVGVPRSSSDYAPLLVMNTVLGGMFSSRINLNLREAHAYTYGARSGFDFRRGAGPFGIGGAISVANTAAAVREILAELGRMRGSDVTEAELAAAKSRLTETLPARFETCDQTSSAVAEIFVYNLPLDEYATITQRIAAVTAADVRRVAERYLDPEHARVVVVGERGAIEPGLRELNLGEIDAREPTGDPLGAAPAPAPPTTPPPHPQTGASPTGGRHVQ